MFITFEGPEGSGKTSQLPALAIYLEELGYQVVCTREPGGTAISDQIREILTSMKNQELHPRTEILLFLAARAQLVEQVIAGGLDQAFLLNVNIPNRPDALDLPRRVTRLGRRHASESVIRQQSPRGDTIYWIGPAGDAREAGEGTDFFATANGQVSITPLQVDLTHHAGLGAWQTRLGLTA